MNINTLNFQRNLHLLILLTFIIGIVASCEVLYSPALAQTTQEQSPEIILSEDFNNSQFTSRGWYDGSFILGNGREGTAAEFRFLSGQSVPVSGGAVRHELPPTSEIYVSYWVRYSDNWRGSGRTSHPHELYLLTNLSNRYSPLARTNLTVYLEQNQGVPLVALQDALNIGTEHGAVAGCDNGPGGCYTYGGQSMNELFYRGTRPVLAPGHWHHVEAYLKLNTVEGSTTHNDGIIQMWWDGELEVSETNVRFRTAAHPQMQFNQFVIAPYMSNSPITQIMWIDNLVVMNGLPLPPEVPPVGVPDDDLPSTENYLRSDACYQLIEVQCVE